MSASTAKILKQSSKPVIWYTRYKTGRGRLKSLHSYLVLENIYITEAKKKKDKQKCFELFGGLSIYSR